MGSSLPSSAHWPTLSALLDDALALPPGERARWLEALPAEHAAHRDALRELLATQARLETNDFLAALPHLPAGQDGRDDPDAQPGALVGDWRLIEQIAQGGMGTVWLAQRADGLVSRRVALKLPRAVWGDTFAERLAREREILATLEHEHVARLYDAGLDAQGRPFLVMEYVEGERIDAWCRAHASTLRERLGLMLQVMAAVSHAHGRLVVHRDLKPGNILVTPQGRVKLLDFGIAKLLEGGHADRSALTEIGGRALTPDYASPEQIRGEALGTASDVYSLGVVAFELLAGALPYRLKRGSAAEMEEAIATAEPRRASEAATSPALRKALRGDLDAILQRALRKSPAQRYPGVDAFAQDIERYLQGKPVQARPDGRGYRAVRFVQRHRWPVAMSSALAIAIVAGSAASLWQARVARQQEARAVAELQRQRAVADLYDEAMMRLSVMATDEPAAITRPHAVTGVLLDKLREFESRLVDRPSAREAQLAAVMLQLNYDNEFDASLAVGETYLAFLKAHDAPAREIIEAESVLGRTLFKLKRVDDSEAMRRAAVDWMPAVDDDQTETSRLGVAVDLAGLLTNRGKRAEAHVLLARIEDETARHFPRDLLRAVGLGQFSNWHLGFDDVQALADARHAQAVMRGDATTDSDYRAEVLKWLSNAQEAAGLVADAERTTREVLAIYLANYGRASPNTVLAFTRAMGLVARQGDYARAEAELARERDTLSAAEGGLAPVDDDQLRGRQLEIAWLRGDVAGAPASFATDLARQLVPTRLRTTEFALLAQVRALALAGRGREAVALARDVAAHLPDGDRPTAQRARVLEALAVAQLADGDPTGARATARSLSALFAAAGAPVNRGARAASELAALAAARLGDLPDATQSLGHAATMTPPPAFLSSVERAESTLRRAEILARLGRAPESAAAARSALADLAGQAADSPRLAQARRLAAGI